MAYNDDDLLSVSGIQHFVYCRRQWGLIHIEQQWAENLLTVDGKIMHERVHDSTLVQSRKGVLTSCGMSVVSYELGLYGVCDAVEFIPSSDGAKLHGREGRYAVVPVEYKHGEPKETDADILQVAAQAACLEDMLCTKIRELDIFYGQTKRRQRLEFSEEIRSRLKEITEEMHALYRQRHTPRVKQNKNCRACSLKDLCLPKLTKIKTVDKYISDALGAAD